MTQSDLIRHFIRKAQQADQGDRFEDTLVNFILQVAQAPGATLAGLKAQAITDKQRALQDLNQAAAKVTGDIADLTKP